MTTLNFQTFINKRRIERAFELCGFGDFPKFETGWDESFFNKKQREKERRDESQYNASLESPCLVEMRPNDKCVCDKGPLAPGTETPFTCGKCTSRRKPSRLFWIDSSTGYVYCENAQHIFRLGTTLSCSCGQKSRCSPRLASEQPLGIHYTPKLLLTNVAVEIRVNCHSSVECRGTHPFSSSVVMPNSLRKRYRQNVEQSTSSETLSVNSIQLTIGDRALMKGTHQLATLNRVVNHLEESASAATDITQLETNSSMCSNITFQQGSVQLYRVVQCTFWLLGEYFVLKDSPEYIYDANDLTPEQLDVRIASLKQEFLKDNYPMFSDEEMRERYLDFVEEEIEHQENLLDRFE